MRKKGVRKMAQAMVLKSSVQPKKERSPHEITRQLELSMKSSPIRTDKEAARKFLSQLSMYDENGQLKKEP